MDQRPALLRRGLSTPRAAPTVRLAGRAALLAALLVTAGALAGTPAEAHTDLVASAPEAGASLDRPPNRLRLVFAQPVTDRFAALVLTPGPGTRPDHLDGTVEGATVRARLGTGTAGRPGRWKLAYRVVADDGHPITGSLTFTVRSGSRPAADGPAEDETAPAAPPADAPSAAPTPTPVSPRSGAGEWVSTVVIGIIVLVGTAVALFLLAGWSRENRRP